VSVDLVVPPGADFDTKDDAIRNLISSADRSFITDRLNKGAATLLHRPIRTLC